MGDPRYAITRIPFSATLYPQSSILAPQCPASRNPHPVQFIQRGTGAGGRGWSESFSTPITEMPCHKYCHLYTSRQSTQNVGRYSQ